MMPLKASRSKLSPNGVLRGTLRGQGRGRTSRPVTCYYYKNNLLERRRKRLLSPCPLNSIGLAAPFCISLSPTATHFDSMQPFMSMATNCRGQGDIRPFSKKAIGLQWFRSPLYCPQTSPKGVVCPLEGC